MLLKKSRATLLLAVAGTAAAATFGGYSAYTASQRSAPTAPVTSTVTFLAPVAGSVRTAIAAAAGSHLADLTPELISEFDAVGLAGVTGVFVHFKDGTREQQDALLARHKLVNTWEFRDYTDAVYVVGTVDDLLAAAREPSVYYVEQNVKVSWFDETGPWASRIRVLQETVEDGPYYANAAKTQILTGRGVGVSVVDSGMNGLLPDLQATVGAYTRVVRNFKVVNTTVTEVPANTSSDTTGGHGTHCVGIAAGSGVSSRGIYPVADAAPKQMGSFTGAAPEANIYAYGVGEGLNILFQNGAFQDMLNKNAAAGGPAITVGTAPANPVVGAGDPTKNVMRVVSNSWGSAGGGVYNRNNVTSQLVVALVKQGVTVVFAAGNDGNGTTVDTTSPTCKDPTPGVICVASYNDSETGSTEAVISDFSSQGAIGAPANYPDIAAPGSNITSPCLQFFPGQAVCATGAETRWQPFYGTISGTSMATPQIAGFVALMLQARPELTPPQIEEIMQDNARKLEDITYGMANAAYVSDPQNPGGTTNYRAGAGLLDAPAVMRAMGVAHETFPANNTERVVVAGDNDTGVTAVSAGAADIVGLSLKDTVEGGASGVEFKVTVRDAASFAGMPAATAARLVVEENVGGKHFSTSITLRPGTGMPVGPTTVTADGLSATTSAVATSVSLTGNTVRFFVPQTSLGSPALGTPVHNIVARSTTTTGTGESVVDYAPNSAGATLAFQGLEPAYGKPYTIVAATVAGAGVAEDRCTIPGLTTLTDAGGDAVPDNAIYDLLSASVAQPFAAGGSPLLVFRLKVASLAGALTPNSAYFVSFNAPDGTVRGVRMVVPAVGAPTFLTYTASPSGGTAPVTDGRFVGVSAPAAAGSNFTTTGEITIFATPASVGITEADPTKWVLSGFNAASTVTVGVGVTATQLADSMPEGLARVGSFSYRANAFCKPNTRPVAFLSGNPVNGSKALTVSFDAGASTDDDIVDADDSITNYSYNFGDGSVLNTTLAQVTHTYIKSGSFNARVTVTDSRGKANSISAPSANVPVTVSNTAPMARLTSDYTTPKRDTVTVNFDASTSFDPNESGNKCSVDCVLAYSFDFGDGAGFGPYSESAVASHTYGAPGSYVAKVKVKDQEDLESGNVATQTIVVTANNAPMASLSATPTSGSKPLAVSFDATASADPDGDAITYSFDLDGAPGYEIIDSGNPRPNFTYTRSGSYTASVMVKDDRGLVSVSAATVTVDVVNDVPVAKLTSSNGTGGVAPFTTTFSGATSTDANGNGDIVSYSFDVDGDGTFDAPTASATRSFTYNTPGTYSAALKVIDSEGATSLVDTLSIVVMAANTAPTAKLKIVGLASGRGPLTVNFDAGDSTDPEGNALTYAFDLDGDGVFEDFTSAKTASRTYTCTTGGPCKFSPAVKVKDTGNLVSTVFTLTNGVVVTRYEDVTGRLDFSIAGAKTVAANATSEYPAGTYEFDAKLCKKTSGAVGEVYSTISSITRRLDNNNGLKNRTSGPANVGSVMDIPGTVKAGAANCAMQRYVIGLKNKNKFTFLVDFNATVEVP